MNIQQIFRGYNFCLHSCMKCFSREPPIVPGIIKDDYLPTNYSNKSPTITIFGSTGFFGRYLLEKLAPYDYQLILPYRGDTDNLRQPAIIGNTFQNIFKAFVLDDENLLSKLIDDSDIVINLLGRDFQSRSFPFDLIHVDFPATVARIIQKKQKETDKFKCFIHLSALGASENPTPKVLNSGSNFLRTKWLGEQEVMIQYPHSIILRPATMWGYLDRFIFYYLHKSRRLSSSLTNRIKIPVWNRGLETVKQPIYAGDVANIIHNILLDPTKHRGLIYELVGPQRFQLNHLITWFYLSMRHEMNNIEIIELEKWHLRKWNILESLVINYPLVTKETIEKECQTESLTPYSVESNIRDISHLNIRTSKLEDRLEWLLKPNRWMGYCWDNSMSYHEPPTPPLALSS